MRLSLVSRFLNAAVVRPDRSDTGQILVSVTNLDKTSLFLGESKKTHMRREKKYSY